MAWGAAPPAHRMLACSMQKPNGSSACRSGMKTDRPNPPTHIHRESYRPTVASLAASSACHRCPSRLVGRAGALSGCAELRSSPGAVFKMFCATCSGAQNENGALSGGRGPPSAMPQVATLVRELDRSLMPQTRILCWRSQLVLRRDDGHNCGRGGEYVLGGRGPPQSVVAAVAGGSGPSPARWWKAPGSMAKAVSASSCAASSWTSAAVALARSSPTVRRRR